MIGEALETRENFLEQAHVDGGGVKSARLILINATTVQRSLRDWFQASLRDETG